MIAPPPSRNAACPCGSGKRYRDCHGALNTDPAPRAIAAAPSPPPSDLAALRKLANSLFDRGDFGASAQAYDRLFALRRDLPAALWVRRGTAQQRSGQLAAAEASFREAAVLAPDDATIHSNVGTVCLQQGRYADADAPLSRALELDRDNVTSVSRLVRARQQRCAWDGIDALFATLERLLARGTDYGVFGVAPFPLLAMPFGPQTHLQAARNWARGLAPAHPVARPTLQPVPGERLRIGFVSADFREHPVGMLMVELWERLDRSRVESFAYGIKPEDRGPIGQRIRNAFEHFADVSQDPVAAIAQRIRDDRIAIVFDLNGYTGDAKSKLFALRPAPLQINYFGYPGTLGAAWYDYIVVDRVLAPATMQPYFTEQFLQMPNALFPCDTTRAPKGPPPTRAECGLPAQGFVFCCFNGSFKILPPVFASWMRLLHAVPGSVLWLAETYYNADAKANLRLEAARAGVALERLIFAPRVPNAIHVARNATADLFLDTFPYGAGATANDALLAGLPIVTCAGETLVSRICGSQLHAIGLPELVTNNLAEYEALALRLAQHPPELAALRQRLAANRWTHPLFDMPRYTRDFEDALFRIWREHAAAGSP